MWQLKLMTSVEICYQIIKVTVLRKAFRGTHIATTVLPSDVGNRLLVVGQLRIG